MPRFSLLYKSKFPVVAPELFRLLHENMDPIAPSGLPFDAEYRYWYEAVGEGLQADARNIILIQALHSSQLLGFLQYYTNPTTLMIEELQIIPEYQSSANILRSLIPFLLSQIPADLQYIEAFVHKENARSISLQKKLGMEIVGTSQNGALYHLRGSFPAFRTRFTRA